MTVLAKASDHPDRFRLRLTATLGLGLAQEVEGEASEDGEGSGVVIGAVTFGVLAEGDVEHPVQAVLDGSMAALGLRKRLMRHRPGGDVERKPA
jgi:hypothetical protein